MSGVTSSTNNQLTDDEKTSYQGLKHLPHWPPVNLEFKDIVFSVNDGFDCK